MARRRNVIMGMGALVVATLGALVLVGAMRDTHITTVTQTTDADPDVMWNMWADVPRRTEWDRGLEYIKISGGFQEGATGTVRVKGQDPISYEIVDIAPKVRYTDRFTSLPGTHTDWHHTINERPDGRSDVTWRLSARGPLSLIATPVLKSIFGEEVPIAVTEFVRLAEERTSRE